MIYILMGHGSAQIMFVQDSMDLQQNIGFHGKNILKGYHKTFLQVSFLPFQWKLVPSTELCMR